MVTPKIIDIRNALVDMAAEMTIANEYNFDWSVENRDDLARKTALVCITIKYADETNIDEKQAVGVREYYNQREFTFVVNLRKAISSATADNAQISAQEKMEYALSDIKKKFNSVSNKAGDAGANDLQYLGFKYIEEMNQAKYQAYAGAVKFRVKYNEGRF